MALGSLRKAPAQPDQPELVLGCLVKAGGLGRCCLKSLAALGRDD